MTRLTEKNDGIYRAADPEAALRRLGQWEDLYEALSQEREAAGEKMRVLNEMGKSKTASYRQLFALRLQLGDILTRMEAAVGPKDD